MKKVLFIFAGKRRQLLEDVKKGAAPDTQLYGMDHISGDFSVTSKEFSDTWIGRIGAGIVGFRLRHFLMYFWARSADIVVGSALFYMLPLKKLLGARGKFIVLNISLNRYLNDASRRPLLHRFSVWSLRAADRIVSLSHVQLDELAERHGINRSKLEYIPLGVDVGFYRPVFGGRKGYVLSVGRDNGRDYKTVVEVARQLSGTEFHLVLSRRNIAGLDDIPPNVKVFFDAPIDDTRKMYAEASMLLLVTHADGHSDGADCSGQTVLLDAFASGLPVIASRKAYLADYAHDGEHLILVDFYDVRGIIRAMRDMPAKADRLARNARTLVESDFSTQKMGERLSRLFSSLAGSHP